MRLTRQTNYAIRILMYCAANDGRLSRIPEIAKAYTVSELFLFKILQPLVENAVHHGVAHLLEGGDVCVTARRSNGLLEIIVENPCDPDRPPSRGTGMGIANVRSRVETLCGNRASVDVDAKDDHFRVSILLPATGTATSSEQPEEEARA